MPYWPPDTPPEPPAQMPQATSPGPAPVPYGGPGFALAPSMLAAPPDVSPGLAPGAGPLDGVTGANHVSEAPLAAPNVNPYEAGGPQPVYVGGDADAGGRDDVAGSVAEAVVNAYARQAEHLSDLAGQGSVIGDVMTLPHSNPLDPGVGALGEATPTGAYYDPPRNY